MPRKRSWYRPAQSGYRRRRFDRLRRSQSVWHRPLNPDTDYDGLTDGEEVHNYKTNPLLRDTDGGGVADGHEVIEDNTNPLDPLPTT